MVDLYKGQWIGTSGSGAYCVVNIADSRRGIKGHVCLHESVELDRAPFSFWTMAYLSGEKVGMGDISGSVNGSTVYSNSGEILTNEERRIFEEKACMEFPIKTAFKGSKAGLYKLEVEWVSKYQSGKVRNDKVVLEKQRLGGSVVAHENMTWEKFKEYASAQDGNSAYRGQAKRWRLQSSYHRTGNADLITYLDEMVPELENHINAHSKHEYDIKNDRSLGGLLSLAQHHGYPTPLLDWSRSPYVAAFFAFENETAFKKNGSVSIFSFKYSDWSEMAGKSALIRTPKLIVRALELPGYGNPRVLPQQSVTMFSNVDDIENIILKNEAKSGQFLSAVSISVSEREKAMKDLTLMGITWGSMFPGVEGICKQLNARHFLS